MRKKLLITAAAIILSAGSITGGTMAVYSAATHTDKTISTSSIGVSLNIADDGGNVADSGKITSQRVVQKVSAQNTGGKPQDVRVKVDKQWLDSDSQTVVTQRNGEELNTDYIGISYVNTDDWIYAESTDDNGGNAGYLYYTVKNLMRLLTINRRMSPLTGLPGNVQINSELKKHLLKNNNI